VVLANWVWKARVQDALATLTAAKASPVAGKGLRACALVFVLALAFALDASFAKDAKDWKVRQREAMAPAFREFMKSCPPRALCLAPLVLPSSELPAAAATVALSEVPGKPVVVELLDMSCPACRHEYRTSTREAFLDLLATRSAGLRLLIWPKHRACNAGLPNAVDGKSCESNTALLCAARAGAQHALAYMDAEVAKPNEQSAWDRQAWLAKQVSPAAAVCYRQEVADGFATLRLHADAARKLKQTARARAPESCGTAAPPWWCFHGTPSFAVFADLARDRVDASPGHIGQASNSQLRWNLVQDCVRAANAR